MKRLKWICLVYLLGCSSEDKGFAPVPVDRDPLGIGGTYQAVDSTMQLLHQMSLNKNGSWVWKTWTLDDCLLMDAAGIDWGSHTSTDGKKGFSFGSGFKINGIDVVTKHVTLQNDDRLAHRSAIASFNCQSAVYVSYPGFAGGSEYEIVSVSDSGFLTLRDRTYLLNEQPAPRYNVFWRKQI